LESSAVGAMEIFIGFDGIKQTPPAIITVGTFDGVHLGHQQIVHSLTDLAAKHQLRSTLVTFQPHPQSILQHKPNHPIYILTNMHEKVCLLENLGLQRLVVIEFTREFSELDHVEFIKGILIGKLNMRSMIVGDDHAFGRNRSGTYDNLKFMCNQYHFTLHRIAPFYVDQQRISSTIIRRMLMDGKVDQAARFLGRSYLLRGIVVKGEGRGQRLHFPTANIEVENHDKLIPGCGVYAVACKVGNTYHRGMANIGYKPTFGGTSKTVEVHIFNFEEDIYGRKVAILFLQRLRSERKFTNEKELIEQLTADKVNSTKINFDLEVEACL
jgi:riboflavin kinase/FMN adenylyltransferase